MSSFLYLYILIWVIFMCLFSVSTIAIDCFLKIRNSACTEINFSTQIMRESVSKSSFLGTFLMKCTRANI